MTEVFTENEPIVNRRRKSLLLYFESCMVDNEGFIKGSKINSEEVEWARYFIEHGIISEFSRVPFKEIIYGNTHYVRLTDLGWTLAHRFRRERADAKVKK